MIINNYLDEDFDPTEVEDTTAHLMSLQPHAGELADRYQELLVTHAALHLQGMEDGPLHTICVMGLIRDEKALWRLKRCIYN